ncbi:hypothetical protein J2847_003347 [Azospirillum agricola]|uniref:caspase family protein n=1 Tax=Azospirillum agricola TaxID=1720247 RepID=UPI001AE6920F|nr:caspase family protein [Azospirillum agricola]MBP2230044.1 hypothetical protein [Azospirillum agricola]
MKTLVLLAVLAAAAWFHAGGGSVPTAWSQRLSTVPKDIVAVPVNPASAVDLTIEVDGPVLREGTETRICFSASQSGYVTLWNVGTSGRVARIFPYTDDGQPVPVKGGQRYCAGDASASHAFRVNPPYGAEDSYLVWTRAPDAQPRTPRFESAAALAKDVTPITRLPATDWATAKVTYDVVPPGGPVSQPAPPVRPATQTTGSGRTWILGMGANVAPLVRANDDARRFTEQAAQLFRVPASNVRLIANAYRRDFEAGMAWLAANAGPDDLVLIYFSGHGSTVPDDDGDEEDGLDEVFIPFDVEGKAYPTEQDIVRDDRFAEMVGRIRTNRVVSVLDTCHSGGLRKSFTVTGARTKFLTKGILGTTPPRAPAGGASARRKDLPGGVDGTSLGVPDVKGLVVAAAREDQYALEGADGSLFTLAWLEAMARGGTLRSAFQSAAQETERTSRGQQNPTLSGDLGLLDSVRLD